jgi:hypothetical protein
MRTKVSFKFFILFIALYACNVSNSDREGIEDAVAKAGNEHLSKEDLLTSISGFNNLKDSNSMANKAIENWAKESLFYQEAINKLDKSEMLIEQQVEAYRKELVNYIYQSKIIEANLDTLIENGEIDEYYNLHRDNFILKENIVKVNYIKVPLKAPVIDKIKKLTLLNKPNEINLLKSLCAQYAENYFLNDSTWLFMDEVKREIPALRDQPDFSLVAGRVVQYADNNYFYFLRISEVKIKNALSPLNFERQNIKKFIMNTRKSQLITQYKQLLFEKAKSEKKFQTFQ